MQKSRYLNRYTHIEALWNLLGKTFLKKGSFPDPFLKTFSPNFAPMGYSH